MIMEGYRAKDFLPRVTPRTCVINSKNPSFMKLSRLTDSYQDTRASMDELDYYVYYTSCPTVE